jgi:CTP synthase (UTP-ammonia lyase)
MASSTAVTTRLALVGDRSPLIGSHRRVPLLLDAMRRSDGLLVEGYWIASEESEDPDAVDGFDGVWLLPGSPYRSEEGALTAVRTARERKIPFLGTCAGFQHAVLEYARNACGLAQVAHAERRPDAGDLLIVPLACSLVGHEGRVRLEPGSRAERALGTDRTVERYHCSYGLNPAYVQVLASHGLQFTGFDENDQPRIVELPGHPFFLATLFQPELAGDGSQAHPLIHAFVAAAADRAEKRNRINARVLRTWTTSTGSASPPISVGPSTT